MYFDRAACAIILCLVAEALSLGSSTERSSNKLEAEDATSSKPDMMGDNVADSSVTSYSSIVIHHTPGKAKGSDAPQDQEKEASRSESYFKIGKSSLTRTREEKSHRRPTFSTSVSSSSSNVSPVSPASTTSLRTDETRNHRAEPHRTKPRDVSTDNFKSFPKIKHFEGDFRPIEGPTTEEPRRPQRLVNHHYNPHHHESSEEDVSTSLANSHEIFRKEPKYRDYDQSGEVHSAEYHSAEDFSPKFRKGYKDDKKHVTSFGDDVFRKPFNSEEFSKHLLRDEYSKPLHNDEYRKEEYRKPQHSDEYRKPQHSDEYRKPQHNDEYRKPQHNDEYRKPQHNDEYRKPKLSDEYRKPQLSDEYRKPQHSDDYRKPLHGGNYKHYSDPSNTKINDYSNIYKSSSPKLNGPTPPPGMSEELMETLLQQEPQKFSDGEKSVKGYPSKKKFKSAGDNPTTFNVGYSIGFGGAPSDDVIFGKPKEQGLKLHVNGEKSVWKQLNSGVEMSHNLEKTKPLLYRVPETTVRPKINVLKNGGSSVFYMNNNSPDIENVPTVGKSTFDHNHALTHTNFFDFSNAMQSPMAPIALPLTGNIVPEAQPYGSNPKSGRNLDVMGLYQSMGYSPPIPVLIPNGPKGEAQMVHAIVIPLQSLPNVDLGWGQLQGMFPGPGLVAGSVPQPVHYTPAASMPQNQMNPNSVRHNSIHHSGSPFKSNQHSHNSHVNHHPVSNPFPAIPEKIRTPKYRKSKDAFKSGSAFSSPIVVSPVSQGDKRDLQRELNAILAQEMSRKNHRHTPLGLRPPPPQ